MAVFGIDGGDPVVAADFNRLSLCLQVEHPVHQEFFEMILLEVDEGRVLVPVLGQQVELVDLAFIEEHLAGIPGNALFDHRLTAAEPVEDFERPFGKADCPRAERYLVVVVQNDDRDVLLRQIDCRCKSDRPRAHDNDRVADGRFRILICGPLIGIERGFKNPGHAWPRSTRYRTTAAPSATSPKTVAPA